MKEERRDGGDDSSRPIYYMLIDGVVVPCYDVLEWGEWFETAERKRAQNIINGIQISTIFLGLDHGFGEGAPVLWETMIFGGKDDQDCWRYTSEHDALHNHHWQCERTRKRFFSKRLDVRDERTKQAFIQHSDVGDWKRLRADLARCRRAIENQNQQNSDGDQGSEAG